MSIQSSLSYDDTKFISGGYNMALYSLLKSKKNAILKRWFDLILETYPPESARFIREEKDGFINPVGASIAREIDTIFNALLDGKKPDEALDCIIRIRAVQDFTPSQAIGFVFSLKKAIRDELTRDLSEVETFKDLSALESGIDELALVATDFYMKCREQIHAIRLNELKTEKERAFRLLASVKPEAPE